MLKRIKFVILFFICLYPLNAFSEDGDILTISYSSGGIQLDPAHSYTTTEAQLFTAIYEGLVTYNPLTLEPTPGAASKWIISPDGKTYTFFLRPEGRYWNGETVTASDFRDAWLRLLNPEEHAEYSFMLDVIEGAAEYRTGKLKDPEKVGIKEISPLTLQIKLKEPADYFLKILCHHAFSPVNPLNIEDGKWKEGPSAIGNGPFMLYSNSNDEIIFKKNKLYWDESNIKLSELHVIFSDDADTITEQFNESKILWAPSGVYYSKLKHPDNIVTNPLFGTTYFYFKGDSGALKDSRVRRGLCLMLPWEQIRSQKNFYIPSQTLVPSIPGYPLNEGINKREMQEALQLLYKAGYQKGKGIGTIRIRIPESRDDMYIASIFKDTWEKFLDVKVEIEVFKYDEYFDKLKEPEYSMGITSWVGDYADPLTFLQMWTSDSNLNDSGYKNPEYDELLHKSLGEKNTKERYKLMAGAEKILLDGGIVIPLQNYPAFNAVNLSVLQGWYPNVLDIHPFKYMFILKPKVPNGAT
ncbi:MAG: peptide ABC transporter substrate-binding protein [Spirochaetales bacterium]|nr:peptide ABC transporter substrate-binding protein [Spirochaetales bacterium]